MDLICKLLESSLFYGYEYGVLYDQVIVKMLYYYGFQIHIFFVIKKQNQIMIVN